VFQFCSGLVDLVVGVGHHGGGGHRLTLAGERFVGLVAEDVAEVGDRGGEFRDCRSGEEIECEDSGNRFIESHLAIGLSRLEPKHGDPLDALDHITLAIRNFYDSGNIGLIRSPLATLAVFLDRLGRLEPAATIVGL
jgi:hypothetical protein